MTTSSLRLLVLLCLTVFVGCKTADLTKAQKDRMQSVVLSLEAFRVTYGCYPSNLDDLQEYALDLPVNDVWGTSLVFCLSANRYCVTSAGPDQMFGTSDDLTREHDGDGGGDGTVDCSILTTERTE
jgi:hypothetical protein